MRIFVLLLLCLRTAFCFAGGIAAPDRAFREALEDLYTSGETVDTATSAGALLNPFAPELVFQRGPSQAERIMKALARAHPKRLSDAVFKDGDWAVELRGEWYYYAEGRLLPERLRDKSTGYTPQPFYIYPEELPEWRRPTPEEAARNALMSRQEQGAGGASGRAQVFFDELWNVRNRAEAWSNLKTIRFLGKDILVHHAILEELALVEQMINAAVERDPQVKRWLSQVETISSWNWRTIADTRSRSNHAYGIAVDLLPAEQGPLETYWIWAAQKNLDWWEVPYSRRLHPPDAVIKSFEAYGFIWGGKWTAYDTMHFEYRPEILFLNGIPLRGEY